MATRNRNRNNLVASIKKMIAGIEQNLGDRTIQLLGREWTGKTLVAALNGHLESLQLIRQLYIQWTGAIKNHRTSYDLELLPLMLALRAYVTATWGPQSDQLDQFGFPRRSRTRTQTAESKQQAVERTRATRKARTTMGRRQKQRIHGDIGDVATAANAPASPDE